MKKIIWTGLLVLWMLVIFLFSSQTAPKSQSTSDAVASGVIDIVTEITNQKVSSQSKQQQIENTRVLVRKTAHFTAYLILGILVYGTLDSYQIERKYIFAILFCFLYACSDELHQMFLAGRTARFFDIMIDTSGGLVGSGLCFWIKNRKGKKERQKNACIL